MSWFRRGRQREKFSLENLKYLYQQLTKHPLITRKNEKMVVETIREIAELMIWGDQHNDNFFFFFCEKSIFAFFLKILGQPTCDRRVKIQLLQTLSIMMQNVAKQMSLYYLLSNNHINDLIVHPFDFSDDEVTAYYVSFLKTLSLKLNQSTLQFFFNAVANDFPLYTEAIKFYKNREKMVRIAVRVVTLNVYSVNDPDLRKFVLNRSAVPFFLNLVWFIRDHCLEIKEKLPGYTHFDHSKLKESVEEEIDNFFYLADVMSLGIEKLTQVLIDQLLAHFVIPCLIGSIYCPKHEKDSAPPRENLISSPLALFMLSQLFDVMKHRPLVASIVCCLLDKHPPKLVEQLVNTPLTHALKDDTGLCEILCPPSALKSPPGSPRSKRSNSRSFNSTPNSRQNSSMLLNGVDDVDTKPTQDDGIPVDRNVLNPRSYIPKVKNVETLKEFSRQLNQRNTYREHLLACLESTTDEHLVLFSACVLLTVFKNDSVDTEMLEDAGVCPQKRRERIKMLPVTDEGVELPDSPAIGAADAPANVAAQAKETNAVPSESSSPAAAPSPKQQGDKPSAPSCDSKNSHKQAGAPSSTSSSSPTDASSTACSPHEDDPNQQKSSLASSSDSRNVPSQAPNVPEREETSPSLGDSLKQKSIDPSIASEPIASSSSSQTASVNDASTHSTLNSPKPQKSSEAAAAVLSSEDPSSKANDIEAGDVHDSNSSNSLQPPVTPRVDSGASSPASDILASELAAVYGEENRGGASPAGLASPSSKKDRRSVSTAQSQQPGAVNSIGGGEPAENRPSTSLMLDSSAVSAEPTTSDEEKGNSVAHEGFEEHFSTDYLYPLELVDKLLSVMGRYPKPSLVTFQAVVELFEELVFDSRVASSLSPEHTLKFEEVFNKAIAELQQKLNGPLGDLFLDTFEEEWRALTRPFKTRSLISNPISLLPIAQNAISGVPLEFRHPAGLVEQTRRSIQVFLVLRALHKRLIGLPSKTDSDFPFMLPEQYKLKPGSDFKIEVNQDLIECHMDLKHRRTRVYLVLDKEYFLVVSPNLKRNGWSIVQVAFPLHSQQAIAQQRDNRLMVVKIRSGVKPHPSCVIEQGTHEKPLWILYLYFADALHCMTAVKQLDTLRVQLRSTMMSRLTELATPPPASIPQSPLTTASNFIHGASQVPPQRLGKPSTQGDSKQTLSSKAPTKEELLRKREPSMIPRAETTPLERVTSAP